MRLLTILNVERQFLEKAVNDAKQEVERATGLLEGSTAILIAATAALDAFDQAIKGLPSEYIPRKTTEALNKKSG